MDEAHKQYIPVAVHLPKDISAAEASDAGVASLEHAETLVESQLWRPGATAKDIDQALAELDGTQGTDRFILDVCEKPNMVRAYPRSL
jgi:hypothetical protein